MPSTFSTSDLTPLLQAAPTAQMRYASGTIVSWDPGSFENVIEVRGSMLINLPVLSGPDALTYKAGDVVALVGADQQGARGVASYAILGRFVVPGAGRAEQAIEWMTSELGRAFAAAVIADRIRSDPRDVQVVNSSAATWESCSDGGPSVQIEITKRGAALVLTSTKVGGQDGAQGMMSFEISGATTRGVNSPGAASFSNSADPPAFASATSTGVAFVTDLNEGLHTFQAKIWSIFGDNGSKPGFSSRNLTVIGF